MLIELRLLLALPLLVVYVAARGQLADVRAAWREGLVLGALNNALPFTLIAWGEQHIDSSTAAIANASMAIFVAVLAARYLPRERPRGLRLVGLVIGLTGVGVLTGFHPLGGWWGAAGTLAVVVASFLYAVANVFFQLKLDVGVPVLIAGAMLSAAFLLLPLALATLPDGVPGVGTLATVGVLGIVATGIAQILYFALLEGHGASRASLIVYVIPPFALLYGVSFLGETARPTELVGLALILAGIVLAAGRRMTLRTAPVQP